MRRLVLCCDGRWNRGSDERASCLEKIAWVLRRGLVPGRDGGPGVMQRVGHVGDVGAPGPRLARVLAGALGLGMTRDVVDGYQFLATSHEPGDEIVVLGCSRGAYTARSIVGMLSQVGLLTREALHDGRLPEAARLYRRRARDTEAAEVLAWDRAEFRRAYARQVPVRFLGVFDTVGALGVPVLARRTYRFHDVRLADQVEVARQAVTVGEGRSTVAPSLWDVPADDADRVRQAWFPSGSDGAALRWMVEQLRSVGVAFDEDLLPAQGATDRDRGGQAP
ncbi:phospholipase effector Tle1 domain-containing protein [Isoptericola croceus]|uniref:phospholipase effector Tle1 domain-containing protein n=1 Tax=Isoptericola croceus TaxID=3031406 RepID=UPI0023F7EC3A|nr:DUF2235 domain-containing protein [Isoptericola croceus]